MERILYQDEQTALSHEEHPLTILIADDEPVNLALIKRCLEREGYRTATAENGRGAVEQARKVLPDLIILDIMMPVLDGLEACRQIKTHTATRDIPVIFLSARDDTDIKVDGLLLGANDFISKPFRTEELLARVNVAMRLKRERDELRASVEEARRHAENAHEMSMADALTGLRNRYGLQRSLAREFAHARRYNRPLACLMIDVDNFKWINDTYRHQAGDAALMQLARILTDHVRRSDVVCRYGGDEFLVLMPETELEGATALGEKICAAAATRQFGDGEQVFPLTLSVGVAELSESESGNDMIARADAALYQAKQAGRNRVEADRQE